MTNAANRVKQISEALGESMVLAASQMVRNLGRGSAWRGSVLS